MTAIVPASNKFLFQNAAGIKAFDGKDEVPASEWTLIAINQGWSNFLPDTSQDASFVVPADAKPLKGKRLLVEFEGPSTPSVVLWRRAWISYYAIVAYDVPMFVDGHGPRLCILEWEQPDDVRPDHEVSV